MELWSAFVLGIAGSLHCAMMCGPLLLALTKARGHGSSSLLGRLAYQFGRILTYAVLGIILGSIGQVVIASHFQRGFSLAIGTVLLASLLVSIRVPCAQPILKLVGVLRNSMLALVQHNGLASQFLMGSLNGLLPCGLVYLAAAGALVAGRPIQGAVYMVCFGLGTFPLMLVIHQLGARVRLPDRLSTGGITRAAVFLMAGLFILRGLDLGIPYLSPVFPSSTACGSCH